MTSGELQDRIRDLFQAWGADYNALKPEGCQKVLQRIFDARPWAGNAPDFSSWDFHDLSTGQVGFTRLRTPGGPICISDDWGPGSRDLQKPKGP